MLCQFTFQNFKSYKSETTLDFQATALPEFKDTLITEAPASDLLPVSVVYENQIYFRHSHVSSLPL